MSSIEEKKASVPSAHGGEDGGIGDIEDAEILNVLGYEAKFQRNRSMFTLLFQSLAIAAVSRSRWKPGSDVNNAVTRADGARFPTALAVL